MNAFTLVWAGLCRKQTRTVLTMASIVVAFLLYGLLQGVNQGMNSIYQKLDVERVYVQNRNDVATGLPLSYRSRIARLPHVGPVMPSTYFGGFYRDAQHPIPVFATDIAGLLRIYQALQLPPAQLEATLRTRTGAIVGADLAAKYGWKIGDRVPIGSSIWALKNGSSTWHFDITGIVDTSAYGSGFASFYINHDYFDAARAFGTGFSHYYVVSLDDPRQGDRIGHALDALFANSSHETKTQSEQAWAQSQMKQTADINFIANAIVGAVMFTLLFLTGNTMMQSLRERVPELAVLKTLGFKDNELLLLILCESLVLCVSAAAVGLLLARTAFIQMGSLFGQLSLPFAVITSGFGIAVLLAIVSGLPPALRARRLNVVDALAGR